MSRPKKWFHILLDPPPLNVNVLQARAGDPGSIQVSSFYISEQTGKLYTLRSGPEDLWLPLSVLPPVPERSDYKEMMAAFREGLKKKI